MISQKDWADEFERLASAFPSAPVRSMTVSVYRQALAGATLADFRAAVDRAIDCWEYAQALPPPVKLRRWAEDAARPRLERERRKREREEEERLERARDAARNDPQVLDCRARLREMMASITASTHPPNRRAAAAAGARQVAPPASPPHGAAEPRAPRAPAGSG